MGSLDDDRRDNRDIHISNNLRGSNKALSLPKNLTTFPPRVCLHKSFYTNFFRIQSKKFFPPSSIVERNPAVCKIPQPSEENHLNRRDSPSLFIVRKFEKLNSYQILTSYVIHAFFYLTFAQGIDLASLFLRIRSNRDKDIRR